MRTALLALPLLLAACTIRSDGISWGDGTNNLSFAGPGVTVATDDNSGACDDMVWRGSQSQDFLNGTHGAFCGR